MDSAREKVAHSIDSTRDAAAEVVAEAPTALVMAPSSEPQLRKVMRRDTFRRNVVVAPSDARHGQRVFADGLRHGAARTARS